MSGAGNIISVAAVGLSRALVADATLAPKIYHADTDSHKIVLNFAPTYMTHPYIQLVYIDGAKENLTNTQSMDVIFAVSCVDMVIPRAEQIADDIERVLADQTPSTFMNGWGLYAPIQNVAGLYEIDFIQQQQYVRFGAHYRIRLVEL
jgi:hypothetical protein